jgi:hypothetical protein
MAKQETLNKEFKVIGGQVVIEETTKKILSKDELLQEKMGLMNQQAQIMRQIASYKEQYNNIEKAMIYIDAMIAAVPDDEQVALKP